MFMDTNSAVMGRLVPVIGRTSDALVINEDEVFFQLDIHIFLFVCCTQGLVGKRHLKRYLSSNGMVSCMKYTCLRIQMVDSEGHTLLFLCIIDECIGTSFTRFVFMIPIFWCWTIQHKLHLIGKDDLGARITDFW